MKVKYLILVLISGSNLIFSQWNKTLVGTAPSVLNLIRVGDGRNDGKQRVYAICEDAHVYEWTYIGGGNWSRVDVGILPGSGWCLGIDIGKGKNDGLNRIYATRIDGNIYEFFYNGTQWVRTPLGNPNSTIYGVFIGPGRNDGINRVYASGDGVPPVEYSWSGSSWIKDTVQNANLQQWLPYIGSGRNDGVNRLYLPNSMGPIRTVAEYTWNGSSFIRSDLPAVDGNPLCIVIGPGRNDGMNRVYASSRAKAYEFTYQGGIWQTVDIIPGYTSEARYNIALGRTKADGKNRVYITCSGTQFLEASWNGSVWVDTVIDAVSAATCGVAIGRGRNDDTTRVYGCNRNGEVWEFTHTQPYTALQEDSDHMPLSPLQYLVSYPNPFITDVKIIYTIKECAPVKISVYTINGAEVITLVDKTQKSGKYEYLWNGKDNKGHKLSSGVYFLKFKFGNQVRTKALILYE